MSNFSGIPTEVLYTLTAPFTKNNFTTQAIISAPTTQTVAKVPASYFSENPNGIGKALWGHIEGTAANTAAATLALALGWDVTAGTIGTSLGTILPATAPTAATTVLFKVDFFVTATAVGPAGLSLQVNTDVTLSVVASGASSTAPVRVLGQTLTTGLISTAQAFIELLGTWSAASASNTTTINQFLLFGVN